VICHGCNVLIKVYKCQQSRVGEPPKRPCRMLINIDEMFCAMCTNGTAVEGVSVTGAAIRLIVPVASMELSRWQAGMARYLPSRVRLV
jgi:hypothetical protein